VNDAWRRITGRDDWAGRPWFEGVRAEDRDGVLERWRGLVAQGAPFAHEFRLGSPAGADVWVLGQCRAVTGPDGTREGFVGTLTDVTERRAIEAQLRHAQKMEAVGQMTSGIAHDFRNILTVVQATAESVERNLPAADADLRLDLEDLRKAARRGADITRKLLAFSRMDHLAVAPVDLCEAVAEGIPMLRRLVPATVEIAAELPDEAMVAEADLDAVSHILANLTANARDAMPGGGTVRIGVGHVRHEGGGGPALPPGAYVMVSVSDTGTGMDDATRARIFDPFFTTKPPGAGTGLGMPMVLRLVEDQGGAITVTSAPGAGTTVRLYFRAASRPEPVSAAAAPAPLRGGHELILLVEDDEALRRAAQRALERLGYRVLAAADGLEALEVLRRHAAEIALVVSDSTMPRLTGPELYATIRREGMSVPFLLASGYGPGEPVGESVPDAAVPSLPKPWTLEDLAEKVREVLDRG
jgi:PAS domain S-box-containing protein